MKQKNKSTAEDRQSGMANVSGRKDNDQVIDKGVVPIDGRDPRTKPLTFEPRGDDSGLGLIKRQSTSSKFGLIIVLVAVVLISAAIGWSAL